MCASQHAQSRCKCGWDTRPSPGADMGRGEPSPGADVGRGEPSPGADVGRGGPSPGADVRRSADANARSVRAGPSCVLFMCLCMHVREGKGTNVPVALHADCISAMEGIADPLRALETSVRGPGSPLPHLLRDWAHPRDICTGTGLSRDISAPAGSGLTPPTSAPGLDSTGAYLRRDCAVPPSSLVDANAGPLRV